MGPIVCVQACYVLVNQGIMFVVSVVFDQSCPCPWPSVQFCRVQVQGERLLRGESSTFLVGRSSVGRSLLVVFGAG